MRNPWPDACMEGASRRGPYPPWSPEPPLGLRSPGGVWVPGSPAAKWRAPGRNPDSGPECGQLSCGVGQAALHGRDCTGEKKSRSALLLGCWISSEPVDRPLLPVVPAGAPGGHVGTRHAVDRLSSLVSDRGPRWAEVGGWRHSFLRLPAPPPAVCPLSGSDHQYARPSGLEGPRLRALVGSLSRYTVCRRIPKPLASPAGSLARSPDRGATSARLRHSPACGKAGWRSPSAPFRIAGQGLGGLPARPRGNLRPCACPSRRVQPHRMM